MKKNIPLLVAFFIVWAFIAGLCYILNILFNQNWFTDWHEYVVIGLAGAIASIFGPILSAWIEKIFKKS